MNFCAAAANALCFHLADGIHLTRTLEKPSLYNLHWFSSVAESVPARRPACFLLIIKSSTLALGVFEHLGGVSPVETLRCHPCSSLPAQTHLF